MIHLLSLTLPAATVAEGWVYIDGGEFAYKAPNGTTEFRYCQLRIECALLLLIEAHITQPLRWRRLICRATGATKQ